MPNGYPMIASEPAYRRTYRMFVGEIADGYEIDHLCRVPRCVNPRHLQAVPPAVNNWRSDSPASVNARKTHCIRGHEFTPENTLRQVRKTGKVDRKCRACHALRERLRRTVVVGDTVRWIR